MVNCPHTKTKEMALIKSLEIVLFREYTEKSTKKPPPTAVEIFLVLNFDLKQTCKNITCRKLQNLKIFPQIILFIFPRKVRQSLLDKL